MGKVSSHTADRQNKGEQQDDILKTRLLTLLTMPNERERKEVMPKEPKLPPQDERTP
jgi:hypothetical protein